MAPSQARGVSTIRLWRDASLGAAIAVAPIAWALLYLAFSPGSVHWLWPLRHAQQYLLLVLLYPLGEELIFRGALQGELRRFALCRGTFLGPVSVANAITSLLFAGAHLLVHQAPFAALVIFPSLVFGYFRDRFDASGWAMLAIPIGLHVWYNAGFVLVLRPF